MNQTQTQVTSEGKWDQLPEKWKFVRAVSRWEMVGLIKGTEKQQFGSTFLWPEGEFVIVGKGIYLNLSNNYYEVAIRNERKLGWVKQHALAGEVKKWDSGELKPTDSGWFDAKKPLFEAFKGCDHTILLSATAPERTKTQEIPVIDLATLKPKCEFCKRTDDVHDDFCPKSPLMVASQTLPPFECGTGVIPLPTDSGLERNKPEEE